MLENAQLIVVEYGFKYIGIIHNRNLGSLSFFRIVDICEKCVVASDPYSFRLLVIGRKSNCVVEFAFNTCAFNLIKCNMHVDPTKYKSISYRFEVFLREQSAKGLCIGWMPTLLGYSS